MPTSEHKDDEVEALYDVIEEILDDNGNGNKTPLKWGTGILLLEMKHRIDEHLLDHIA
jgi:hypothetical protein